MSLKDNKEKPKNKEKRHRAPNWEDVEKKLLREVVSDYVDLIENKNNETNTNKKKLQAWKKIYESFNELNMRPRKLEEIKQQWRTVKTEAKKVVSDHRIAMGLTGGGPRPASPDEDTLNLVKLLPLEFEVDYNKFDCDGPCIILQDENEGTSSQGVVKDPSPDINNFTQIQLETECTEGPVEVKTCPTKNSSKVQSKRNLYQRKKPTAMNSVVKVSREAQQIADSAIERSLAAKRCLEREQELKLLYMQESHELKLKHMTEAHEWAREEHSLRMELLRQQLNEKE